MSNHDEHAIRERLAGLFARASLDLGAGDLDKVMALVMENQASAERVRRLVGRYDEPGFGFPARRRD